MPDTRDPQSERTVLVTGVSGYLGGHVALAALTARHRVIGGVRRPEAIEKAKRALAVVAGGDTDRLSLATLDLLSDQGWAEAAARCDSTIHVASPFVTVMPRDPDDLIRPAVEGTRRAVHSALAAGHGRIVLTSSMAAVHHGHDDGDRRTDRRTGPISTARWSPPMRLRRPWPSGRPGKWWMKPAEGRGWWRSIPPRCWGPCWTTIPEPPSRRSSRC